MPDDVTVALANFFYEAWEHYRQEPTEDVEALLANCPLVEEYTLTEQDVKDETYDGEEGDTVYVLSEMGKVAWSMAS